MRLIVLSGSSNCRKVMAVAHHLNIDLPVEHLDATAGDLSRPDFLNLNPNGMVPVLVDGDFVLWESNAIMRYLADGVAGQILYPEDRRIRADINRWLDWELAHYNAALAAITYEVIIKPQFLDQQPSQTMIDSAVGEFHRFAAVLEDHLQDCTIIVGRDWTLADYAVGHLQATMPHLPVDLSAYPRIQAFYDRLADNRHWQIAVT